MCPTKTILNLFAGAGFAALMAGNAHAFDDGEKQKIEEIVRAYLVENPEILIEMQASFEAKQEAAAKDSAKTAFTDHKDALRGIEGNIVLGDPEAPYTMVEFFDYNCGYCKRALGLLTATLEKHKDVKVIIKEWPILSQDSYDAHQIAIGLHLTNPELYKDFHIKLLSANSRATGDSALKLANELGGDEEAIKNKISDGSVDAVLAESNKLAEAFGIRGTPAMLVGEELIPGAISIEALETRYAALRECGKTKCT